MTKKIILSFVKQFLFWLCFFALNRAIFLIYNIKKLSGFSFLEILSTFIHAIRLDISMDCYFMIIPFLLILFVAICQIKFFNIFNKFYTFLLIIFVAVMTSAELGVYDEWRVKLNYKAISYLSQPSEVFRSARTLVIISGFILIFLQSFVGIFFYQKFFHEKFIKIKRNFFAIFFYFILTPGLLVLGLRGGFQQIPLTQSDSYFSKNNILNQASVNTIWNLGQTIWENRTFGTKNPFEYYNQAQAEKTFSSFIAVKKDTTIKILNTDRPNIVLILLESWSGDNIASLSDLKGIDPNVEKLISNGLLFTNCYATGTLSDQGMISVFSGYPSLPYVYLSIQPDKFQKLPCIVKKMKEINYSTSFYFGGQLSYGNIKGYMIFNQFDKITEGEDFPSNIPQGKLGIHDGYTLKYWLNEIGKTKQPFFTSLFTVSSHSPFDEPMKEVLHWGGEEKKYINSVYYADSCLGNFFREAAKQKWFDNTLFVLVADHSHDSPKQWNYYEPNYKKIPLLFFGNVLKKEYRGKKIDKLCSQNDVTATLLAQMNISHKEFRWSKNLFNPYEKEFAFYAFHDGYGWLTPNGSFIIHNRDEYYQKQIKEGILEDSILINGKSYIQSLYSEYLKF